MSFTSQVVGATGTTLSTAIQLLATGDQFYQVTPCTSTNYGIQLPNGDADGTVTTIRNDGVWNLNVYPNGNTGYIINNGSLGVTGGAAYVIAPNSVASFQWQTQSSSAAQWYVWNQSGVQPTRNIAAATTIEQGDNGSMFYITPGAGFTITLPAPTIQGLRYGFVLGNTGSAAVKLDCGAGLGNASLLWGGGAGTATGVTGACNMHNARGCRYVEFSTNAGINDRADVISDGTNWYCFGSAQSSTNSPWTIA